MRRIIHLPTETPFDARWGALAGSRLPPGRRARLVALILGISVWFTIAAAAVMVVRLGGGAALARLFSEAPGVTSAPVAAADHLGASFSVCGTGRRVNCVVDGDTFWYAGTKIRIADIDTPELSPPRCEAERVKGEAARARLRELLDAGPFSLVRGSRDEDHHRRKLRRVTRDGVSLGDVLVREGLARPWGGARRSWCGP